VSCAQTRVGGRVFFFAFFLSCFICVLFCVAR
jgi:hypothetical protein